jgi:hypothetical protein
MADKPTLVTDPNKGPAAKQVELMGMQGQMLDLEHGGEIFRLTKAYGLLERYAAVGPCMLLVLEGPSADQLRGVLRAMGQLPS